MFSLLSLIPLLVSLVPSAYADDGYQGKIVGTNSGCNIKGLNSAKGFDATFYTYPYNNDYNWRNTAFYANGEYAKGGLVGSASGVDPNLNYNSGATQPVTSETWGVELPITNFVGDYSGYFYGTYYIFFLFPFSPFFSHFLFKY